MSRLVLIVLAASLIVPHRASAQLHDLQPGLRVRVTAPPLIGTRYDATVGARRADTISLVRMGATPINVPVSAIVRAEVFRGKSRGAGARRGLLWGVGIGVALTALTATLPKSGADGRCPGTLCKTSFRFEDAATVIGGFGFWGTAIGALIGRERWEPLNLAAQSGTRGAVPPSGRITVGLRLTY